MTTTMLIIWIGGSALVVFLIEFSYQRWCRKNGIEPRDIFG